MSDGGSVDLLSDAVGFIGGSGDVISCCRGIGVVVDLISRGVGIVGCVSGCQDSSSALGDIYRCMHLHSLQSSCRHTLH